MPNKPISNFAPTFEVPYIINDVQYDLWIIDDFLVFFFWWEKNNAEIRFLVKISANMSKKCVEKKCKHKFMFLQGR